MRNVLVDYARKHNSKKRGGEFSLVPLFDTDAHHCLSLDLDALADLNGLLERLGQFDPRALTVVELKFFAGFTNGEAADILRVSDTTVEAIWSHARLWLLRELRTAQVNAAVVSGNRSRA